MLRPYFYTDTMMNGSKFEYTFLMDFDIADHFGIPAIKDTYERCLKEWKGNIKAIAEMYICLNMRLWFWYEKGNETLARVYDDLYYKLRDYVYGDDTPYNKEELNVFYRMTD